MAAKEAVAKGMNILLGKCVPSVKANASKFKVKRLVLDTYLNMYFNEYEYIFAHDPQKICKNGDTVLLKKLPEKLTTLITHKVDRIIYPLGDITDPVTGKKVTFIHYREQQDQEDEMYGALPTRFQYDKAPPRGWQEDKRDLTHRESYIKFNEDGKEQKYAV
ncbi:28S ribosomal protein S17, mitochondrial [Frankliniella fusca]|uniref:28S ribosomal protein S17, mitochondrial n=1 Tax=Frankliniella fusca TaxID=407009 RepID=A0AAE1GTJ3_9NEOP|nr:28S ribosomal protein S17, mitochondrial [Frankliniella fusca]